MTLEEYQKESLRTDNYQIPARLAALIAEGEWGKPPHNKNIAHVLHCTIALSGEVGEINDQMVKHCFYNRPLDVINLLEELGDCLWFINKMCQQLGSSMEDVMQKNVDKLRVRYPESFSYDNANIRNLEKERQQLEKQTK